MNEIEILGAPDASQAERFAAATLAQLELDDCHVAVEFVDEERMQALNREHRDIDRPTDVLSFPVDGEFVAGGGAVPNSGPVLELGDVVICAEHTADIGEAVVHGLLHLCGFDHETDTGQMLALQDEIVDGLRK